MFCTAEYVQSLTMRYLDHNQEFIQFKTFNNTGKDFDKYLNSQAAPSDKTNSVCCSKPINIFKDTWGHRSVSVSHPTEEKRKTYQWGVGQGSLLWHVNAGLKSCLISQRSQVICHVGSCSVCCLVGSPSERHLWTCSSSSLGTHTNTHTPILVLCCLSAHLLPHLRLDIVSFTFLVMLTDLRSLHLWFSETVDWLVF